MRACFERTRFVSSRHAVDAKPHLIKVRRTARDTFDDARRSSHSSKNFMQQTLSVSDESWHDNQRATPGANVFADAFRVYFFAVRCALRAISKGMIVEGLKLLVSPVGYWRFFPNAFVLAEFRRKDNPRVLDASSPKLLSLMLADGTASEVYATDLEDEKIETRWKPLAEAAGLDNYVVEYQDARRMRYADEFFDLVYSISVIEHIPGDGDADALREFRRVLKPGGVLVVEVPYRREREELFARYDSKGAPLAEPRFYERHYDDRWLTERLEIEGLQVEKRLILGERLPLDPLIAADRLPRLLRIAVLPFEPLLAALNYWFRRDDRRGRPLAALIVYRKLPARQAA